MIKNQWMGLIFRVIFLLSMIVSGLNINNPPVSAESYIKYVKPTSAGVGDCSSWSNACTLQVLLAGEPASGDHWEVWMAQGTYYPTDSLDQSISFNIVGSVSIFGGFSGIETAFDQRSWVSHPTILSGDIGEELNYLDNSSRGINIENNTEEVILDGLSISSSATNVKILNSNLSLSNIKILDRGGIIAQNSHLNMDNVEISGGNSRFEAGGLLAYDSSQVTISNSYIHDNYSEYSCGGIQNNNSMVTVVNTIFSGNWSTLSPGAAFRSYSGTSNLTNVTMTHNKKGSSTQGTIYVTGNLNISNSILYDNEPANEIRTGGGTVSVQYSLVEGGYIGTGNINLDPAFLDADQADYRLSYSSPAIDAGSNSASLGFGLSRDMFGINRYIDVPSIADTGEGTSPIVDMGAYETQQALPIILGHTPDPNELGDTTSIVFDVIYPPSAPVPSGNVTIGDGIDSCTVDISTGNCTITFSSGGIKQIQARYDGDGNYSPSYSFYVLHTVRETQLMYVKPIPSGLADCSSWNNACTLADVTNISLSPGISWEVWVAKGTHYNPYANPNKASFILHKNVELYGGFSGIETSRDERNWESNITWLSAYIPGDNPTTARSVVDATGTDSTSVLDGFALTGGGMAANAGFGGGLRAIKTSGTFRNLWVKGNNGGGMAVTTDDEVVISNIIVENNSGSEFGGIYLGGNITLVSAIVRHNSTRQGGGIYFALALEPGIVTIINSAITDNSALIRGGGIYAADASNLLLVNSTVANNYAPSWGAGIYAGEGMFGEGSVSINNSIVYGNREAYQSTNNQLAGVGTYTVAYSLIEGGYSGTGNKSANPLFVDPINGDYRLQYSSPAIDAGNNTLISGLTSDLSGNSRFINLASSPDTGYGTIPLIDIGAYEAQRSLLKILGTTPNPSEPGDLVTILYTVQREPGAPQPTGNVNLFIGPYSCSNTVISGQCQIVLPEYALLSIKGQYSGDVNFPASKSNGMAQNVISRQIKYAMESEQGNGDCSSWENACTLEEALAFPHEMGMVNEIWVAASTYFPTDDINRGQSVRILPYVEIFGGFNGSETERAQRDWQSNPTVLSGDIGLIDNISDNSNHVVLVANNWHPVVLDGFYITGGNANSVYERNGGGLLLMDADLKLANCTISENYADDNGGAIWAHNSNLEITNTILTNNRSDYEAGGIYVAPRSILNISSSAFIGNNTIYRGGALFIERSFAVSWITQSLFHDNIADSSSGYGYGGAIYINSDHVTVTNSTLMNNRSSSIHSVGESNAVVNSIVWSPDNYGCSIVDGSMGVPLSVTYSDVKDTSLYPLTGVYPGLGNIKKEPNFINGATHDYRLGYSSPLIDAGNSNAAGLNGISSDFDGNPRKVDINLVANTGVGFPPVDIGYLETQSIYIDLLQPVKTGVLVPVTIQYHLYADTPSGEAPSGQMVISDGTHTCSGPSAATGSCIFTFDTIGLYEFIATYTSIPPGFEAVSEPVDVIVAILNFLPIIRK